MLTKEQIALLVDRQKKTLISSLLPISVREGDFSEETEWRSAHTQIHYRREVMYLLSGNHSVRFKESVYPASPGTVLLLNSREKHDATYFPHPGKSSHLWLILRPDCINCQCDEFAEGKLNVKFRHFYRDREHIAEINRVWDAGTRGSVTPEAVLFSLLAHLDLVIFDILRTEDKQKVHSFDPRIEAVEKVKSYLEMTNGKNCSIPFLAELAGFSAMHFQRLFKKYTGMTVGEYIDQIRLKRCEELAGVCLQKEIAEELGFSSVVSYCNWRRKMRSCSAPAPESEIE